VILEAGQIQADLLAQLRERDNVAGTRAPRSEEGAEQQLVP